MNSRYPADLRFRQSFENVIERWDRDWIKTWNGYTRRFDFTAGSDLKNIEQDLRPLFASAAVYPNLLVQLLDLRKSFEKQKDLESPPQPHDLRLTCIRNRIGPLCFKQSVSCSSVRTTKHGQQLRAVAINSKGIASAVTLNQIALAIAGVDNSHSCSQ